LANYFTHSLKFWRLFLAMVAVVGAKELKKQLKIKNREKDYVGPLESQFHFHKLKRVNQTNLARLFWYV
jgi:hypothetical protein